ncbi:MAG: ribonuclease III [candidate division NC10 bacterium]|nr:ribonuclease III [candidate division NC10 bacterium]
MTDLHPILPPEVASLQEALGLKFQDPSLLLTALKHPSVESASREEALAFKRLEFLGDAVWNFLVSRHLFLELKEAPQGELSLLKGHLSSATFLAKLAREIGLPKFLYLGKGEEQTGGRGKSSILSSAMEALIAALYLDRGLEAVSHVAQPHLEKVLMDQARREESLDPKSRLQILVQGRLKSLPAYHLTGRKGPPHHPSYEVEVLLQGKVLGKGTGKSLQEAEQKAAEEALRGFDA